MDENLTTDYSESMVLCSDADDINISYASENINSLNEYMLDVQTEVDVCDESTHSANSCQNSKNKVLLNESIKNLDKIKFATLLKLKEGESKKAIDWCMELGLISSNYVCPKCGDEMKLRARKVFGDGYKWFCDKSGRNEHRVVRSIRTGSIFTVSKMNLMTVIMIIHSWAYKVPYDWIFTELTCSNLTLKDWMAFCRNMCVDICASDNSMIGGEGKVIEIIGGPFKGEQSIKKNRPKGKWVICGIEKGSSNSFFKFVEEDKISFYEVITSYVLSGTTVFSKLFTMYNCLEDEEFINLAESNSYTFGDPDTKDNNPLANFRLALRYRMPKLNKNGYYDNTLGEYIWRKKNAEAFDRTRKFILDLVDIYPPRNKDD